MDPLKVFIGTSKRDFMLPKQTGPRYPSPLISRLVLEVNKCENVCVASNAPNLIEDGTLSVFKLVDYVKQKMVSDTFVGFVMATLLDCEDLVNSINLKPHVFRKRVFLFKPMNACILELCVLLSVIENCDNYTLESILSILKRARLTYTRNPSIDSSFLLHSIETLCSTLLNYFKLDKPEAHTHYPGLIMYKLHSALEESSMESQGLLKPIYLESFKMESVYDSFEDEEADNVFFNIFYFPTILTTHLQSESVVQIIKETCLHGTPKPQILS
nr:homolog of EHV2 ORF42 tegument protein UL7 [Macronycteris gammaherpesvirus 1]BEG23113.1 homolog of EHV2 ORF42 tegument protein UL7 [Macronycteris gammaherpesvirus 1]